MTEHAYLVDTDWIIHHLNKIEAFRARLEQAQEAGLSVSIISVAELWDGVYRSRDPQRTEEENRKFLSSVRILGIGEQTCKIFGRLRSSLRQQKRQVPDFDMMIAAMALEHNLTLLTNNRKHFEQIEGLRLESLSQPI